MSVLLWVRRDISSWPLSRIDNVYCTACTCLAKMLCYRGKQGKKTCIWMGFSLTILLISCQKIAVALLILVVVRLMEFCYGSGINTALI